MLKLDIHTHFRLRNTPTSPFYLRKEGGFSRGISNKLAKGNSRSISFHDLELLCKLFRCTPNDLLEWVPDNINEEKDASHPLAPLKKEKNMADDLRAPLIFPFEFAENNFCG